MGDELGLERIAEGVPVLIKFSHEFPARPSAETQAAQNILEIVRRNRPASSAQDTPEMEVRECTALVPFYSYDGVVAKLGAADSGELFEIPGDRITTIKQLYPGRTVELSQDKPKRKNELDELERTTDGTPIVVYHNQSGVECLTYGFFMQNAGGVLHIKLRNVLEEINVPAQRPPGYKEALILDTLITKYQILK